MPFLSLAINLARAISLEHYVLKDDTDPKDYEWTLSYEGHFIDYSMYDGDLWTQERSI